MSATETKYLTTTEAARLCGLHVSKLSRWYRLGLLPDPPRLGSRRALGPEDVERIRAKLREGGPCPTNSG